MKLKNFDFDIEGQTFNFLTNEDFEWGERCTWLVSRRDVDPSAGPWSDGRIPLCNIIQPATSTHAELANFFLECESLRYKGNRLALA